MSVWLAIVVCLPIGLLTSGIVYAALDLADGRKIGDGELVSRDELIKKNEKYLTFPRPDFESMTNIELENRANRLEFAFDDYFGEKVNSGDKVNTDE